MNPALHQSIPSQNEREIRLLLLCAGKYRYLWLIRSAAITWVLFAFVAGSHLLLPFIATLVSFLPSVRHYCQGTASSGGNNQDDVLTDSKRCL